MHYMKNNNKNVNEEYKSNLPRSTQQTEGENFEC